METNNQSKAKRVTAIVITVLVVLFMVVDAGMKIVKAQAAIEGSAVLGWPVELVQTIGILLMIATILYAIPRTAFIGALMMTAYLGGAVSIMMRLGVPFWFPIVMGMLAWGALYLKDERLRRLLQK